MEAIRTEGRKLFEERLKFADKYMIYHRRCRDQERRVHAIADVHTHLTEFFSISPRIGFWSAQGACGKSTATAISYFFVQNPMLERNSGAGLMRQIHRKVNIEEQSLPTVLFDEVQNLFSPNAGNSTVADMLSCYTKGAKRTIWDDGKPLSLDPFCPVFTNGLTGKYEIPANYLERNISLPLERPLPEEQAKDMWLFEILRQQYEPDGLDGDCELRDPWIRWAANVYKRDGLTAERLASLLREWKITPERNGQARGYHVAAFIDPWRRAVKLEMPEWMKQYY